MNGTYSSEVEVTSSQFRPDCTDLLVAEYASNRWLNDCEESRVELSIEFDHDFEQEFAVKLDQHNIPWQYKPRTFAVEWDEDGNFIDSFTPSFFLPRRDLYIELVARDCRLSNERVRKARLLRHQCPEVRVKVLPLPSSYQMIECLC